MATRIDPEEPQPRLPMRPAKAPTIPRTPRESLHSRPQRGGSGRGLASAHDRQRLRERNLAERKRVERMFESVPSPDERPEMRPASPVPAQSVNPLLARLAPSCPVCGSDRLVLDEVRHGGMLGLAECLRCDFLWTESWTEQRTPPRRGHLRPIGAERSRGEAASDAIA